MLKITNSSIHPDYVPELSHDGGSYAMPSYTLEGTIIGKTAHVTIDDMSHGDIDRDFEVVAVVDGKKYYYSLRKTSPCL